jgi:hypothetical protein
MQHVPILLVTPEHKTILEPAIIYLNVRTNFLRNVISTFVVAFNLVWGRLWERYGPTSINISLCLCHVVDLYNLIEGCQLIL